MSFKAAWLDLRAPADAAARDAGLLGAAVDWLGGGVAIDLGCGMGATVAAFGDAARWRLIDSDPALLAEARRRHPEAETLLADLFDLEALPLEGARLATASALLDLMPRGWIEALADRVAASGAGLYAALSYDGAMAWDPPRPDDAEVTEAFNRHQRWDKGAGAALGPEAASAMAGALERRGFAVRTARSPWRLGPGEAALQRELLVGIAAAAAEAGCARAEAWGQARRAAICSAICSVGHLDVLALPQGSKAQSKITSLSSA